MFITFYSLVVGFVYILYILQAKILTPSFCECWIISPAGPAFTDACYRVFLHYYIKEGDALNVGPKCNVTKLAACISCINMPIMERILPGNLRKPTEGRLCTSWRAKSIWYTHNTRESSPYTPPPPAPPRCGDYVKIIMLLWSNYLSAQILLWP